MNCDTCNFYNICDKKTCLISSVDKSIESMNATHLFSMSFADFVANGVVIDEKD